jgi:hypothetical protein
MSDHTEEMLRGENAAWNVHDVDGIAAFYTDDCVKEDIAIGRATRGKQEMKALVGGAFTAMPDMKIELVTLFDCGDWAATEWGLRGTLPIFLSDVRARRASFIVASYIVVRSRTSGA